LARSTEVRERVRTRALLDDVRAGEDSAERLYQHAEEMLTAALRDKDSRTALQAIKTAVGVMTEARGYLQLRGEVTGELGRERTPQAFSIQILCPSAQLDAMPQVVFGADDFIEGVHEEIGLLQRPV
jgi:hypothetical protein